MAASFDRGFPKSLKGQRVRRGGGITARMYGLIVGLGGSALSTFAAYKVFGLLFHTLAGTVIAAIPPCSLKPLLSILVYGLIAYFGGVTIPLVIVFVGMWVSIVVGASIADP